MRAGGRQPASATDAALALVATDMRKAMPRDVDKKSMVPLPRPIQVHELGADFVS